MRLGQEGVYISLPIITKKKKTNADRIRSMTDGELAKLFDSWVSDCACNNFPCQKNCSLRDFNCEKSWLKWLREECKSED